MNKVRLDTIKQYCEDQLGPEAPSLPHAGQCTLMLLWVMADMGQTMEGVLNQLEALSATVDAIENRYSPGRS